MVLETLGESLRGALKKIANAGFVDPALIKDATRDIQRALIQGDVNVKLVLELTNGRWIYKLGAIRPSHRGLAARLVRGEPLKADEQPRT